MSFTGALITRKVLATDTWRVEHHFKYGIGKRNASLFVWIYSGFHTDLASIPRVVHSLIPKTGRHDQAAVMHDLGYKYNIAINRELGSGYYELVEKDRKFWDDAFYEAMGVLGVGIIRRQLMYQSVRRFGWIAWNRHRRRNPTYPLLKDYPNRKVPAVFWKKATQNVNTRYKQRFLRQRNSG